MISERAQAACQAAWDRGTRKGAGVGATPEAEGRRAALGALPQVSRRVPTAEQLLAEQDERNVLAKSPPQQPVWEFGLPARGITENEILVNGEVMSEFVEDGVVRRVAARPPPYLVPNIPMPSTWDFRERLRSAVGTCPTHYNRSQSALYWSLADLIAHDTCYLWTVTAVNLVPDSWFGNMHSKFMKEMANAAYRGDIHEWWGGVRVFEPHPKGHGLHSHLVLRNRMPWRVVKDCAERAGLGRVNVHPDKVGQGAIHYLAAYLGKSAKQMSGVRRWATVGTYDGVGKRDVKFSGTRADRIKVLAQINRVKGMHRFVAYNFALRQYAEEVRDRQFGTAGKSNYVLDKEAQM